MWRTLSAKAAHESGPAYSSVRISTTSDLDAAPAATGSSDFTKHVLENCNKPPDPKGNNGGFECLFKASMPEDLAGNSGAPLGTQSSSGATAAPTCSAIGREADGNDVSDVAEPGWVVRAVSVEAGSVAILYDRELPGSPESSSICCEPQAPGAQESVKTLLNHQMIRRARKADGTEGESLFYNWLYDQTEIVESAMKYFAVPLNRYLTCRCDEVASRTVNVDFKKARPEKFIRRGESGELTVVLPIPKRLPRFDVPNWQDIKDILSPVPEVISGECLDTDDIIAGLDTAFVTASATVTPAVAQSVQHWESNPAAIEQKLARMESTTARLRVQTQKPNLQRKFEGLLHHSLRCDFVQGDALTFCSQVDCGFSGLALIGEMRGSAQIEAWGDADRRDLRTMSIADATSMTGESYVQNARDRVIMLTFVPKGQPIYGKRLRLKLLKGSIILRKIGVFGVIKQRQTPGTADIMPNHEAYDFLFSDALSPKQRVKATLIAEQREKGVRRVMQLIPSRKATAAKPPEPIQSIKQGVRCICCIRFGKAHGLATSGGETRTFHAHSRYWVGCMDGYFDARRDPNEGFGMGTGEQPWVEAYQLHFRGIAVSPCGCALAAITHQRFVIWSLADGRIQHSQIVRSLGNATQQYTTDGRVLKSLAWRQVGGDTRSCLILGCTNGDIMVFEGSSDVSSLELRCIIEGLHDSSVALITTTLDHNFVISASPPRDDTYNMQCLLWPFWEIGVREDNRETQKQASKQISTLSREVDACEKNAAKQRLACQLKDALREKLVRWAAVTNSPTREGSKKFAAYGVSEKDMERNIKAARAAQMKALSQARRLAEMTERLKVDANLNMSEKNELVMDEEEDDIQRVLQILVLSHYQVAMLCQKSVKNDLSSLHEPYLSICIWNLGEARQTAPTSEFRFPKQWVHPGTYACVVSSCPCIIACVPDKGLVLCELVRDFASRERKKADNLAAPVLTFAELRAKHFQDYPLSSMVLLANGVFEDIAQQEFEGRRANPTIQKRFGDIDILTQGISPELLVAVMSPESKKTSGHEKQEHSGYIPRFQQLQKVSVDALLKCFKVVEYRFSRPFDVLAEGENEVLQVQALNNMSDPPTLLLKCTSGKKPRVEIWPSPSAEVRGTAEPSWEDLLADHEPADPEQATEDEAKTTMSEGRQRIEECEFHFGSKGQKALDVYKKATIAFPYSRGTNRTTIASAEGVVVAMIPPGVCKLHENEMLRLRAYYETPIVDAGPKIGSIVLSSKLQQQDLPVILPEIPDASHLHNIIVESIENEANLGQVLGHKGSDWKLVDEKTCLVDQAITIEMRSAEENNQIWHKRFRISLAFHSPWDHPESHVIVFVEVIICGKIEGHIGGSIINSAQAWIRYQSVPLPGLHGMGAYGAVGIGPFKKKKVAGGTEPGGICVLGKWLFAGSKVISGLFFIDADNPQAPETAADVITVPESEGGWQLRCAEEHGDPFMLLWKPRCAQTALYYQVCPLTGPGISDRSSDADAEDPSSAPDVQRVTEFMNMEDKTKVLAVLETSHGVVYSTTGDLFFFKSDAIKHWIKNPQSRDLRNARHVFGDKFKRRQEMYNAQVVTQVEFNNSDMVKEGTKVVDTLQCRGAMSLVPVHRDAFAAGFEQSFAILFFQYAGGAQNYLVLHQLIQMPYLMRPYDLVEQRIKNKTRRKVQRPAKFLKLWFSTGFEAKKSGDDAANRAMMPYLLGFSNPCGPSHEHLKKRFCIVTTATIFFVPLPKVKHDFLLHTSKVPNALGIQHHATQFEGHVDSRATFAGTAATAMDTAPRMLAFGVVTPMCANIYHHEDGNWYIDCVLFQANLHIERLLFAQGDERQLGDDGAQAVALGAAQDSGGGGPKPQAIAVFEPPSGGVSRPAVFVLTNTDIKSCIIRDQSQHYSKTEEWITIASWVDDISEHTNRWDGMLVSPDGRHVAAFATTKSGKDQEVALKLWDSVARELNWDGRDRHMMPTVKCACFSEDSKFFVYCSSPAFRNRVYVIATDGAMPDLKWGSGVEYMLSDQEEFHQCLSGTDAEASRGTDHVILMSTHQRLFYQSLNSPLHFAITPPWLTAPAPLSSVSVEDDYIEEVFSVELDSDMRDPAALVKVYSQKKQSGNKGMLELFHKKGLRDCGLHCPLEIPDEAFSASSCKEGFEPHFARICPDTVSTEQQTSVSSYDYSRMNPPFDENMKRLGFGHGNKSDVNQEGVSRGHWWKSDPQIVGQNIRGQWLQVDLGARFWVRGLRIQGKQQSYVKKVNLQLSLTALGHVSDVDPDSYLLIEENSEDSEMPLNYSEALEALFEKLDVTKTSSTEEVDGDDDDDERSLHDAWFILPQAVHARFVVIEPYDQGGTHESVPGIRIEVYHQVPQLMAFNSADRHGQRYDLYYKTPEKRTRTELSKLSIAIANKMTLHDLFAAFDYKTKDRKAMRQGLQVDMEKFQLLRCALYRSDQNNWLTQMQSANDDHGFGNAIADTGRMVLGLGYGTCYWSLLHELCNGDDQHDRFLSWLVEVGDEAVPEDSSYLASMIVPAHLLVHSAVPWTWAKERRTEMTQRCTLDYHYALFRPMDVMVHKVHDDWTHRFLSNFIDTLDRVVAQLVRVGEEGWWHLRGLIDELPIEMVMSIDPDAFILAVRCKHRQQQEADIKSVDSLTNLDVKKLGVLKEQSGMMKLLVTIPNILGDPDQPKDSLLYRATHPAGKSRLASEEYNEKLESFCGTQLVKILIKYKWEQYVQYLFKLGFLVYIIYLFIFSAVSLQFAHLEMNKNPFLDVHGAIWLMCSTFFYACTELFYLVLQKRQSYFMGEEGLWNFCDWIIIVLSSLTFWFMWSSYDNNDLDQRMLAIALCSTCSIFVWLRSVYFAQGFKEWGQFVHVVFFIFRDSGYFFAMLLVILFGFAHGMYLFYHRDPTDEEPESFSSMWMTLITCYSMMLGELPLDELKLHWLTLVYFFVFGALVSITLLNVLIAKMNDSYATTMARAQGKYSLSLATQIASLEASFTWLIRWRFRSCFSTWLCSRQMVGESRTDEETQQSIRIIDEHCDKLLSDLEQKFAQLTRSAQQVLENATAQQMLNQNASNKLSEHIENNSSGSLSTDQMRDVIDQAMKHPADDILCIKNLLQNALQPDPGQSLKGAEESLQGIPTFGKMKSEPPDIRKKNLQRADARGRSMMAAAQSLSTVRKSGTPLPETVMPLSAFKMTEREPDKTRVRISAVEGSSDGSCTEGSIKTASKASKDVESVNSTPREGPDATLDAPSALEGLDSVLSPSNLFTDSIFEPPEEKPVPRTSFGSLLEPEAELFEDKEFPAAGASPSTAANANATVLTNNIALAYQQGNASAAAVNNVTDAKSPLRRKQARSASSTSLEGGAKSRVKSPGKKKSPLSKKKVTSLRKPTGS